MLSLLRTSGQFLARLLLSRRYVHASQHPIHTSQALLTSLCLFILQYMTLRNRKVVLERVAASYTASNEQSLPLLLNKMTIKAAILKEAAMTAQCPGSGWICSSCCSFSSRTVLVSRLQKLVSNDQTQLNKQSVPRQRLQRNE